MDIRYFAFLERLKRGHDDEDTCLRGEMDNRTRPLTGELGVRIPPGASETVGVLPPVDIPEMIRLFDRFTLKDEMRECIRQEGEWLKRVEETCEEADQRLTRYHQRLHDETEECLQLAKVLTEKKA